MQKSNLSHSPSLPSTPPSSPNFIFVLFSFALKAVLHSSVSTISSRLANTEKSMATEFASLGTWKEVSIKKNIILIIYYYFLY
jgi:hypothetical protein